MWHSLSKYMYICVCVQHLPKFIFILEKKKKEYCFSNLDIRWGVRRSTSFLFVFDRIRLEISLGITGGLGVGAASKYYINYT